MRQIRLSPVGWGLLLVGCGYSAQNRLPDIAVSPTRVAAAPVTIVAYELDAFGKRTNCPDCEVQMATGIVPEMTKLVSAAGGRVIRSADVESHSRLFNSLHAWGTIAAMEIAAQLLGRTSYGRQSVGEWRFHKDLAPLREDLGADFVMIMAFREGFETGGRVIASMIGGMHTYWRQVGVVCIADLRDGRMVWCEAGADRWHNLRLPEEGRDAVQYLLRPILGVQLVAKYGTPYRASWGKPSQTPTNR